MKKILLIEDNKEISNNIKEYLELEDFKVTQAFDGEVGLDTALDKKFDLILLDLMLPEIDGFTIARKLKSKSEVPIIMITAKDSINQKLEGFENGAIDYIVKPFDLRELEARIIAHLKISKNSAKIEFGDLSININLETREFLKSGEKVKITTKEFLIFKYLFENKDRVCTRTDLIEYVWGNESLFDDDSKLDVYIYQILEKN
ncbi:MAG: response regulator transcription factor [Candidatus Gracilibacteria bacterium]|nr:response regulator transcription factor [Candidatus Gracilibacteria bacterium]